jgi:ribosomal protein S13
METETKIDKKKYEGKIIRILSQDIEGMMNIYPGLTKIKGVSWSLSNAICKKLNIEKRKKIGELTS